MTAGMVWAAMSAFDALDVESKYWVVEHLGERENAPQLMKDVVRTLRKSINKPRVFLSYSHKDKEFVGYLTTKLEKSGIGVWLDEKELRVGESLTQKLREAIDSVDFLVAVLSRASMRSGWVQKEIEIALTEEIQTRRVKVLPLLLESVQLKNSLASRLPGFLEGKVYLDFRVRERWSRETQKLIDHILQYDKAAENQPTVLLGIIVPKT